LSFKGLKVRYNQLYCSHKNDAHLLEIEIESNPQQISHLVTGMINEDLLYILATNLHRLPFESRKDAQTIFSHVFRFTTTSTASRADPPALNHVINKRPDVLVELCAGYNHKESALPAGTVLREVLKSDAVAAIILYDEPSDGNNASKGLSGINVDVPQTGKGVFWKFFDWIDKGSFEVGADAFTTFRVGPACEEIKI
jgi:calcium binding protein 39